MSQPIQVIAEKIKGINPIRGVKFWSLPPLIEVYTMKKFNKKRANHHANRKDSRKCSP
jgi:hypothetical protein